MTSERAQSRSTRSSAVVSDTADTMRGISTVTVRVVGLTDGKGFDCVALVNEWSQADGSGRRTKISSCEGTWRVEETADGTRVLVLRTFGSDNRQDKGTVSQALHLDRASALELNRILGEVLPSL